MAAATLVLPALAADASASGLILVSKGRLTGASASPTALLQDAIAALIQINLLTTEDPRTTSSITLASGYLGTLNFIGWTGDLNIGPDFAVQIRVIALIDIQVQLTILTDHP